MVYDTIEVLKRRLRAILVAAGVGGACLICIYAVAHGL